MILLPIGSVVSVDGQKAVTVGYRPMLYKERGTLGYLAVCYPYGFLSADKMALFPAEAAGEGAAPGYMGQEDGAAPGYTGKEAGTAPEQAGEGLLPVGSVVAIEKPDGPLYMIAGYYPVNETMSADYAVVPYPNGIIGPGEIGMIGKSQISRVVWYGYVDEEGEKILREIPGFMQDTSSLMKQFSEAVRFALGSVKGDERGEDEISVDMD